MTTALTKDDQGRVKALVPMVTKLSIHISKTKFRSVDRDELHAVGLEAAVIAVSRYDAGIGTLEGFAFSWVMAAMCNYGRRVLRIRERERLLSTWIPASDPDDQRSASERFDAALRSTPADDRHEAMDELRLRAAGGFAELVAHPDEPDAEDAHLTWRATALGYQLLDSVESSLGEPERTVCRRIMREQETLEAMAQELKVSKRTVQRAVDRVRAAIVSAVKKAGLA